MSKVIAEYEEIVNVADAIRSKTGVTESMTLNEMASSVMTISGTGNAVLYTEQTLTDSEKAQARQNIEAASQSSLNSLSEEIVDLKGAEVPEYWEEHLAEKIETIKVLQRQYGRDCFSFVFITDTHYPANLGKVSPVLAKEIMDKCNIKHVLHAGDAQTRGCHSTKDALLAENEAINEMFAPILDRMLFVEGNHDGAYATVNGKTYAKQLTKNEMFEEYYRRNGIIGDAHFADDCNAYYVDDISNKVRYIGLNTHGVPDDVNTDGTAVYDKFHALNFTQAQFDFLTNEALVDGLTDKWKVVVMGHVYINEGQNDFSLMGRLLSAYKNKTTCSGEYAGVAAGGAAYTNLAEPLPNNTTDKTKWVKDHRLSSSAVSAQSGKTTSNPISVSVGDVVRVKGVDFVSSADRVMLTYEGATEGAYLGGNIQYVSALPTSLLGYALNGDTHEFTILNLGAYTHIRFAFTTPTDPSAVIITRNEEIVESAHGYDYVSVDADFTQAKGEFVGYFCGHNHIDAVYNATDIKCISTRCDAKEENDATLKAERVAGTITEQSFDVFTVTPDKIYATKIGAGSDRVISY